MSRRARALVSALSLALVGCGATETSSAPAKREAEVGVEADRAEARAKAEPGNPATKVEAANRASDPEPTEAELAAAAEAVAKAEAERSAAVARPPTVAGPAGWQTNADGVLLPEGYALQLATRREYEDIAALQAELDRALADAGLGLRPYVLRGPKFWWLMAGDFLHEDEAQARFDAATQLLGHGGYVRKLREFCPGMQPRSEDRAFTCVELEREPEPAPPQPQPIQHGEAEWALVITSNNASFRPGQTRFNHAPKYRTYLWHVQAGALVEQEPDLSVEAIDALLVSDGRQLVELLPRRIASEFPKCDCSKLEEHDAADWPTKSGRIRKSLSQLDAQIYPRQPQGTVLSSQPGLAGIERTLIDAQDFSRQGGCANCFDAPDELDHELQIAAVAGSLVLVVDRLYAVPPCAIAHEETGMDMVVLDLSGKQPPSLAELVAQLDQAQVRKARAEVFSRINFDLEDSGVSTTADQLYLVALFPHLREGKFALQLQYGDQVCWSCMGGDNWGHAWITEFGRVELPPSSVLRPPADVVALLDYVWREHPQDKVVGWSRL